MVEWAMKRLFRIIRIKIKRIILRIRRAEEHLDGLDGMNFWR
jgi:hypothetical protein